jgi:hypothetical protein
MVTEERQRSDKDKLLRKKYIGVWKWESSRMRTIMRRFPRMVVRYMARNRTQNRSWCSGRIGKPKRRNSKVIVWFLSVILFCLQNL